MASATTEEIPDEDQYPVLWLRRVVRVRTGLQLRHGQEVEPQTGGDSGHNVLLTGGRMIWLAIAVGGALGSVARHGANVLIHGRWPSMRFPLATLVVNVVGCLIIGVLAGLVISERITLRFYWREFLFVGLLGGFTTFSTFGLDTLTLARTHSATAAMWNVAGHVALGLLAVQAGLLLGSRT